MAVYGEILMAAVNLDMLEELRAGAFESSATGDNGDLA